METKAAGGLLSVSDLVGLTRFKKCLSFPTSSILDHLKTGLLHITNARLKPAFVVSDSPLSAKQSLEGWHPSSICSFLLAKVHFIHSLTLIMPCPINATPVTPCSLKDGCDFVSCRGPFSGVVHLSAQ